MDENKIITKIINIETDVAELKEQGKSLITRDEFNTRTDEMVTILKRIDVERAVNVVRVTELKEKVEIHDSWIKRIAAKVGIIL